MRPLTPPSAFARSKRAFAPRSVSFFEYPVAVVIETIPPTLMESSVTPRTELPALSELPPPEAELQAVVASSSAATAAVMVRIGRDTSVPLRRVTESLG